VSENGVAGLFLKEKARLLKQIELFTDIRKNPQIKLTHIVLSVLLMPFYSLHSLLSLDRVSRRYEFKKYFGCTRKMVASDSTISRALHWLKPEHLEQFQRGLLPLFEQQGLSRIRLAPQGPYRRVAILDGSQMAQHHLVALCLAGKADYPVSIMDAQCRGKELPTAKRMIQQAAKLLGSSFPELFVLDSLYFNKPCFELLRGHNAHVLIKSDQPSFREVLEDAQYLFDNKQHVITPVIEKQGFDSNRLCAWSMEIASGVYAGYPLQIAHLVEDYLKRKSYQHVECWIVTTDLDLQPEEIREAAHLRWHIENNTFKRLSHHTGTKRFYFKDPKAFFAMLRLFCTAIALLDILLHILSRNELLFKGLLQGIKQTWKNVFSQLEPALEANIFA
jgi:hypothetical protein